MNIDLCPVLVNKEVSVWEFQLCIVKNYAILHQLLLLFIVYLLRKMSPSTSLQIKFTIHQMIFLHETEDGEYYNSLQLTGALRNR